MTVRKSQFGSDEFNDWDLPPQTDEEDAEWGGRQPSETRCNRCGSTDVRWRQQGGKWVLFSLTPGVEHACPIPDDFDVVPE